jgi:hypothetical protein
MPVPASADPNADTDDRSVMAAVKSWFYTGIDQATVTTDLAFHHARLTHIAVDPSATPETFTVTMVADSGDYKLPGSGGCAADTNELSAIDTLGKWGAETYRQQIAAALATW